MTDMTVSRPGQANGAGATDALFLKVFPGEILKSFNTNNIMMNLHMVRSIASGKTAQFPAIGTATASYHVPGTEILGQSILGNEKTISIDSLLTAPVFVANIDEAMSHFDFRGEYANQLGEALALKADKQLLQVAVLNARAAATLTGGNGGSALTNASAATDGDVLAGMIFNAAQVFDEKNVPQSDRNVIVKPAQYYLLVQNVKTINRDWGGAGVYSDGTIYRVAGVGIQKSNNVPSTNIASAETGVSANNTYHGDFSKTVAVAMQKSAIGTVKLLDLAVEKEYSVRHQGTTIIAKYAMGHGGLRPECGVEIATP
jgi:hypothetical protein